MSFRHDSNRRGILQQQSLRRNCSLARLLNTLPSFSLLQRADNPLAAASGQFQHNSMFLQLTCKCPNKNKLPHTHGGLRYKKQDSLKSFPGGRNQQSSIQENWAFRASLQPLLNSSLFSKKKFLKTHQPKSNVNLGGARSGGEREGERGTNDSNLQGRRTAATQTTPTLDK